jgi:predicted DsbA family dithiol-disulfide isomerase
MIARCGVDAASVLVTLASALLLAACQPSATSPVSAPPGAGGDSTVVAEVEGRKITAAELDSWIKEDLFNRQTRGGNPGKLYELRSSSLERMVSQFVFITEAERQQTDREGLIAKEVLALGPISDEEVQAFFDENPDKMQGSTFEAMTERIRMFLQTRREADAEQSITARANVVVYIEAPRYDIAATGPARGPENARITIIEFSDFECPFCKRADAVVKQVLAKYPNDVRVVYRHLPLVSIHPRAQPAAEASSCAGDQGKFWEFHDKLFENQKALQEEDLLGYATELGLDTDAFQACISSGTHRATVTSDAAAAEGAGVTGTPAFFVNGVLLTGAQPAEEFYEVIEAELATEPPASS